MSNSHTHPIPATILDHIGNTPLVRLTRLSIDLPNAVLAKCEHMNPGGSLKDRIALSIVLAAEGAGRLRQGETIIEATGGNTGVGLAMVAAVRGYRLVCVLPQKMSLDKRHALRLLGAEVIVTDDAPADDPKNFRQVAQRLAEENGWFLADQFNSPANRQIHYGSTARELLAQTGGTLGAFVAGAGTGGTISGVGRALKEHDPKIQIVLADPIGSRLGGFVTHGRLGDEDGKYELEGMGGSTVPKTFDASVVDRVEPVRDEDAFSMTLRLIREEGLMVGGSSGACVVAALRIARDETLRGPVVTVLADSWDRYWSKPWMQESVQGAGLGRVQGLS